MKTLFVDTQLFVACAFLTMEEGHSPEAIDGLSKHLENSSARLLLPEVVEIEFFRVVNDELIKIDELKKPFLKGLDDIFSGLPLVMNEKVKFRKLGNEIFDKRKKSSGLAKINARRLFDSENTIKIPITGDILIKAYKRALSGQKPYEPEFCSPQCTKPINLIDADCLIFESILSHFNKADGIEMIFCSKNIKHFAKFDKKNKKYTLHPELEKSFPRGSTIRYYANLPDALNSEFKTKIKKEEGEKINSILGRSVTFGGLDSIRTVSQSIQSMADTLGKRLASLTPTYSLIENAVRSAVEGGISSAIKNLSESNLTPTYSLIENAVRSAAEGGISSAIKNLSVSKEFKGIAGVADTVKNLAAKENNKKIQNKK
jgi:hypothetical protein